jgi:RND family efflux transporter MFP subunit
LVLLLVGVLTVGGLVTRQALEAAPPAQAKEEDPQKPEDPVRVVSVMKPKPGGLPRKSGHAGRVQASARADVYSAVSGVIKNVDADIGSRVKKGQVLAEIDSPLLTLAEKLAGVALGQARGLVQEAQARVSIARAETQAARSVIVGRQAELDGAKAAQTLHQRRTDRINNLNARVKAVGQDEVDEQHGRLETAKAQTAAATAALTTAKADLEVKQSKVAQAEAALKTAQANAEAAGIELEKARYSLGLTKIVAPFDGVVTRRSCDPGQYLRGDGGSQPSLLTVQRTDRMRVVAEVAESKVPLVEVGAAVELSFTALPGVRISGVTVSRLGSAIDPKTETMQVEVDVPNPKQQLLPGMFGSVTILMKGAADALHLPASCLGLLPGRKHAVYVVRDGKAHLTVVQVGATVGEEVEIVSGLKPTDQVVTAVKGLKGQVVPVEVKPGS